VIRQEETHELTSWDSTRLFVRRTRALPPRANAVFVHGVLEHGGRYGLLTEALAAAGIGFYAMDHRGHGRSAGGRGDVRTFSDFVGDLDVVCRFVRSAEPPGLPLFLIGHSMGSLITSLYAASGKMPINGIVLASLPAEPQQKLAARFYALKWLARVLPRLRLRAGFGDNGLTHDQEIVGITRADPLILKRLTLRLASEILAAGKEVESAAPRIVVPSLLLFGTADSLITRRGVDHFLGRLGAPDKKLIEYPHLEHELFLETEPERRRIFADVIQWILQRTG
jgi:acylglycerol lipase